MRETLVILAVILLLLALTAVRYRRQIAAMIGFARVLKNAKNAAAQGGEIGRDPSPSLQLVNCSQCGIWVPQAKAKIIGGLSYCSDECTRSRSGAG
jgi:hypothetical protein